MSELNRDLIKKRLEQLACEDCLTSVLKLFTKSQKRCWRARND